MLALAVVILWVLLFLLPPTRVPALTPILGLVFPVIVKRKYSAPERLEFRELTPTADASEPLPAAAARAFDTHASTLAELGFTEQKAWTFTSGMEGTVVYVSQWVNRASQTRAYVTCMIAKLAPAIVGIELATDLDRGKVSTVANRHVPLLRTPGVVRHDLPRVNDFATLALVHAAIVARQDLGGIRSLDPPDQAAAPLVRAVEAIRGEEVRSGMVRLDRRRSKYRLTWKGAVKLTWLELWPLRGLRRRRIERGEEALLRELGMLDVLQKARAADLGTTPATGLRIADDRGEPVAVARAGAADADDRRSDPRFRAVLAQAGAARQRTLAPHQGRVWAIGFVLFVVVLLVCIPARVPPLVPIAVFMVGSLTVSIARSSGKLHEAERASSGIILSHGLCPSCLYSLESLEAGADGCVVCPECGAAWKRGRIKSFLPAEPGTADVMPGAAAARDLWRGTGAIGKRSKDDRGRPCVLVAPRLSAERTLAEGERRERLDRAARQIRKSGRMLRWAVALGCFALAALFLVSVYRARALPGGALAGLGFTLVWSLVMGLMALRGNLGYGRRAIVRAMLGQGMCPSCASELGEAGHAEADGCTLCAGCGAAWREALPGVPPVVTRDLVIRAPAPPSI